MIKKIRALNRNSTEEEIIKVATFDFKRQFLDGRYNEEDPIKNFFEKHPECDSSDEVKEIFEEIGWKIRNQNAMILETGEKVTIGFETINSFWSIYKSCLPILYPNIFFCDNKGYVRGRKKDGKDYPVCRKYFKYYSNAQNKILPLEILAKLTHSIGDFMPALFQIGKEYDIEFAYNCVKGNMDNNFDDRFDLMWNWLCSIKESNITVLSGENKKVLTMDTDIELLKQKIKDFINQEILLLDYFKDTKEFENHIDFIEWINKGIVIRSLNILSIINDEISNNCKEIIADLEKNDTHVYQYL